ncbi:MAG: GNAT family N-acetyltransferase [Nocardioidaceae bacterium]|nr:GNAT family N-acetyltransferase [Nocardioidaceae bacterium]
MTTPTADVSVRSAWAQDSAAIAAVQVRAWQQTFADVLPGEILTALPTDQFEQAWQSSIARPRDARQRVLVALERANIRGFAATAPATDADADPVRDAEIAEFVVDPEHRGAGHGSRLLHAAVETMRSDRFERATMWLHAADDHLRGFLDGQGWAPDGAHRELDLHGDGAVLAKQVRLHTDLRPH